jgi:hypothetical protein
MVRTSAERLNTEPIVAGDRRNAPVRPLAGLLVEMSAHLCGQLLRAG